MCLCCVCCLCESVCDVRLVTQKHKTHDAGRSLVGVQHNLLSRRRVCRRDVPPALAPRKLEVKQLLIVPGLVRHLQANRRGDDVNGTMAHEKPLTLRLGKVNEPTAIGPCTTAELTARTPQRCDAESRPWDVGVAEGSLKRGNSPLIQRPVRYCFTLSASVKNHSSRITAPSFVHRSRMSSESAMQTDLRLAHSLLT